MNTPSHWLMTVAAGHLNRQKRGKENPRWALALGAIAPDIPLYFLSFGALWYFGSWLDWPPKDAAEHIFQHLYYNDPIWIALHNILHSPTMIALLFLAGWSLHAAGWISAGVTRWGKYFLAACLLHSFVDILTHNDDGPVLFFPFDWRYRFSSPISYWDSDHHAKSFMVFEGLLDLLLMIFVWRAWRASELTKKTPA